MVTRMTGRNRMQFICWHVGIFAIAIAILVYDHKNEELVVFGLSLLFLVLWLYVLPARLANMGFPWWLCYLYAIVLSWIPIPGLRLVPWGCGFFVPPDVFEDSC
jgi:hypothetical protein